MYWRHKKQHKWEHLSKYLINYSIYIYGKLCAGSVEVGVKFQISIRPKESQRSCFKIVFSVLLLHYNSKSLLILIHDTNAEYFFKPKFQKKSSGTLIDNFLPKPKKNATQSSNSQYFGIQLTALFRVSVGIPWK